MRILITGGAGFIGSHLVNYHLNQGDQVVAVDNLSTGSLENLVAHKKNKKFEFVKQDILLWKELAEVIKQSQRVYHLASVVGVYKVLTEPLEVLDTNILGCERILNICSHLKKPPQLIITSTSEIYGLNDKLLSEDSQIILESSVKPRWTYAIGKIAEEAISAAYYNQYKLPILIVRPFNTIGPNQSARYGMVVPRFIRQALKNQSLTIFGTGKQTRSFCDVRDLVVMLSAVADNPKSYGQVVNIGNNHEISIYTLAKLIKKLTHSQAKLIYIPYKKAYGEEFDDVKRRRPNLTRLFRLIKYKYQWNLEKTIEDLIMRTKI